MINFHSSFESAFARVSLTALPTLVSSTNDQISTTNGTKQPLAFCINLKRKLPSTETEVSSKKPTSKLATSPTLNNFEKSKITKRKRFPEKRNSIININGGRESPPFYGFDNSCKKNTEKTNERILDTQKTCFKHDVRKNGNLWTEDESYKQRLLQEQADLELAKKLQEQFDNYAHYTRSSRKVRRGNIRRQTTLEEILTGPYRVK